MEKTIGRQRDAFEYIEDQVCVVRKKLWENRKGCKMAMCNVWEGCWK